MTDSDAHKSGLRKRIRKPAPPAPVPTSRTSYSTRTVEAAPDLSRPPAALKNKSADAGSGGPSGLTNGAAALASGTSSSAVATAGSGRNRAVDNAPGDGAKQTDESVVRSTGSMAIATLISRITGFIRNVLITATLGGAVASAFNVANTLPNLITEIVLGAVLTSLVVPVLVRAEKEDPDRGAAFIRRLLTVSLTLLGIVTVAVVVGAPILTAIMLKSDGQVNIPLTTSFAYLLLPQIIFYGVFSLLMAVLNTKGVFKPGAWAPVANNVIAIATLGLYWLLPGRVEANHSGSLADPYILLLGLGTTLGVIVQALIMLPSLRRLGIDLRPLWGIDDRIKQFSNMGIAIVAYVAISQTGYVITTNIASGAAAEAPTIYQQAWLLLQMPYGIIGVTLLTAIMPRLSRNAADGNTKEVVRDLSLGTRLTMIGLIPIVVFFTAFGRPIANALFAYGLFDSHQADILGWTLSFSSFTLIPYALVLLHLRVFYAREEAWTPTFIILGITLVKVVLSMASPLVASSPQLVVVLLGAANGFGFVAGAIIGYVLLRRALGDLDARSAFATIMWALGASLIGVAVAWGAFLLSDIAILASLGSIGFLLRTGIAGIVFLIGTGLALSRSPLPDVKALGRILHRIPGLRRFAPKESTLPDGTGTGSSAFGEDGFSVAPNSVVGESSALANEGFTASPLLPPMPTQASRPIRFVPGEMVSGGRFRLRTRVMDKDGIRFWRASDQGDPDHGDVALIFVDTMATPYSGMAPSEAATWIAERTRALKDLAGPGLARVRTVTATRTDLLIVADWQPSVALTDVHNAPHPDSAALAVTTLAESVTAAHDAGQTLGLDDKVERLRIDTAGQVYNAFPVVLPHASKARDVESTCCALEWLLQPCPNVPKDIRDGLATARKSAGFHTEAEETSAARTLAEDLRAAVLGPESGQIPVIASEPDTNPRLATSQAATRKETGRAFRTGAVIVSVVIVGAVVAAIAFGLLNKSDDAPITGDSVRRGPAAAENAAKNALATELQLLGAEEWQAANDNPGAGPDNPADAKLVADGNPETQWSTSTYFDQLGDNPAALKPGVGVVVKLNQKADIREVAVTATPGALIEVRSLSDPNFTDLAATTLIGSAEARGGETRIAIDENEADTQFVLLWITHLPTGEEASAALAKPAGEEGSASNEDSTVGSDSSSRLPTSLRSIVEAAAPSELLPVGIAEVKVMGIAGKQ